MKHILLPLFVFGLFLTSCDENVIDDPKVIDLDLKSKELVAADNAFGIDLFKKILSEEEDNFTLSPLSISLALAMTYNGAKGETKAAMEEALRVSGLTTDEINASYQSLVKALLEADPKVTLEIAQSIWYRMGYNVLDTFKEVNQTYYDAEVNELDFSRSDAKDIMNGWIEEKTHDKIKNMIAEVKPDHVMFLINAVYFNGEWTYKFDRKDTRKQDFVMQNGNTIEVDMMTKTDSVNYQSNELFSAIEMPYGRGNFTMVVLLPNSDKTCADVADELTPDNWKSWMESFSPVTELDIQFPKFKDEYKIKLNDVLSAMGMGIAFNPGADFSGINRSGGIWIDYVQHNTFIDVSEKGTEAAAATVVAMIETAMPSPPVFHVNRPFIYAITEKETGAILFLGRIVQPEYAE
ncbi:MAG TPA: serpin family protein [Prolixibacteraceae bacterium]|nr:serpin family protein [Prolixibacteraceae bacterium]